MKLIEELRSASLLEAESALSALAQGEQASHLGDSVVSWALITSYRIRADHVSKQKEAHWIRLGKSTGEFVSNMHSHMGAQGEWIHIGEPGGNGYRIYRLKDRSEIIGCMYVIPAINGVANIE